MSNFVRVPLGKQAADLDVTPQFQPYSGVEIITGDKTSVFYGSRTNRVLTIENEWGTKTQAKNILAALTATGFRYQPFTATGAVMNPAAEIGDGITINGMYSGIYKLAKRYAPLILADVEAPQDEELNHEYPFETKQTREYQRAIAETLTQITQSNEQIQALASRTTKNEQDISSLTVTTNKIKAEVVSKSGGSEASFGWDLTSKSWTLYATGQEVFKATKNGITVGGGNFKVTKDGNVSANNMTLTGTLTIGGADITAATLRSGAQTAFNNSTTWTGTTSTVNSNKSHWSDGATYGKNYNNATKETGGIYPGFFKASVLSCSQLVVAGSGISVNSLYASWKTKAFYDRNGNYIVIQYLGYV